jgi:hypothetical protein
VSHPVVGDPVERHIFARACGVVVDGLEDLIGDAVQFQGRVKREDGIIPEGTTKLQKNKARHVDLRSWRRRFAG